MMLPHVTETHRHGRVAEAARYLAHAEDAVIAPSRRRGFDWAVRIPGCIQHMTDAQLIEYAENVRTF